MVGEIEYFNARKSDDLVGRLLTGLSRRNGRPLKKTTVFDEIAKLRDKAIDDLLHPPAQEDLGLDGDVQEQARKKAKLLVDVKLPASVMLNLPAIGDNNGVTTSVLTDGGLFIELKAGVLNWLVLAVQHMHKDDENEEPKDTEPLPKHVSLDSSRQAYKARFKGKMKWFPLR